jgi:predicted secreted protein
MIASTLGKKPDDIVIESLDFDNAGSELRQFEAAPMMLKAARADAAATEPSFEPGFTSLNIKITGKLRLK